MLLIARSFLFLLLTSILYIHNNMALHNSPLFNKLTNRREPYYVTDDTSLDLNHFYLPEHYSDTLSRLLVPHGMIVDRVEKLASDIAKDYEGNTIHMLCVLKGGSTFFGDLSAALRRFHDYARLNYIPYTFDFVRVKSYSGTESTGHAEIVGCDVNSLVGKHVLFVEDIIDTGLTMSSLVKYLHEHIKPASVRVASLVEKRTPKSCGFKADYVGFSIPDVFVVGYCLDFNEVYRDLKHLAVINQVGFERFKSYEFPKAEGFEEYLANQEANQCNNQDK